MNWLKVRRLVGGVIYNHWVFYMICHMYIGIDLGDCSIDVVCKIHSGVSLCMIQIVISYLPYCTRLYDRFPGTCTALSHFFETRIWHIHTTYLTLHTCRISLSMR